MNKAKPSKKQRRKRALQSKKDKARNIAIESNKPYAGHVCLELLRQDGYIE